MTKEEAQTWCEQHAVKVQFTIDNYTLWIPAEDGSDAAITRVTGKLSEFGTDVAMIAAAFEADKAPRWLQIVDELSYPATLFMVAVAIGTLISVWAFKGSHTWFVGSLTVTAIPVLAYWFWPFYTWEHRRQGWWGGFRFGLTPLALAGAAYGLWRVLVFVYGPFI